MSRLDKVNQQLKREIGQVIQQELADPRLEFVSITHTDVSRDLRHARVYYSVLGNQKSKDDARKSLESARGTIRKYIGSRLKMRFTPELVFIYDKSITDGIHLEETIHEIHEQLPEDHSGDQTV